MGSHKVLPSMTSAANAARIARHNLYGSSHARAPVNRPQTPS